MEGFYPKSSVEFTSYKFESYRHALPLIKLIISMAASSLGMSKSFQSGVAPILSKDSKLDGILCFPFLCVLLLNTMFGCRVLCIENAFFTSYRYQDLFDQDRNTLYDVNHEQIIEPIVPTEYRLLIYLAPSMVSFLINAITLLSSCKDLGQHVRTYPQILIACCFTPFMYEGCTENSIKIWKLGTLCNAIFLGCFPQIVLLGMNYCRGIDNWNFLGYNLDTEGVYEGNDALFKYNHGNSIFAIISCTFYLLLIIITFFTDKVIQNHATFFKCTPMFHHINPIKILKAEPNEIDSSTLPAKTIETSGINKAVEEKLDNNGHQKLAEFFGKPIFDIFKRTRIYLKKYSTSEGNIELKMVMTDDAITISFISITSTDAAFLNQNMFLNI